MTVSGFIIALFVFGVLVFFHELGHFVSCKISGVRVNEFAIGMGPALFSIQRGDTRYTLRLIPMGGFCAMEGEDEDNSAPDSFGRAKLHRRILIIAAGSLMNILLGFIILTVLTSQQNLMGTTVVSRFYDDSVSNTQLQVGDEIIGVGGRRVRTDNDLAYELRRSRDGVVDMEVVRDGENLMLYDVTFQMRDIGEGMQSLYLDFAILGVEKTPAGVMAGALDWTKFNIKMVWGSLLDLISGRYGLNQLSGPVGVTAAISQASTLGLDRLLELAAFISINLAVFNLLPLPALDGGRLLFLLLELVRRKPINPKYEGLVHGAGFALLISLVIFATYNDIVRLVTGWFA